MPPSSRSIAEEGVLIDAFPLVVDGAFRKEELLALLSNAPRPARNLRERLSDLQAQVAANRKGMLELQGIVRSYGMERVGRYMEFIRLNARHAMNRVLEKLAGESGFREYRFADRPAASNGSASSFPMAACSIRRLMPRWRSATWKLRSASSTCCSERSAWPRHRRAP